VRVDPPEGAGVLVRAELAYERPFVPVTGRSLELALGGDVGDGSSVAALELTVRARRAVVSPVVEISLPAGVETDAALLDAIRATGRVAQVDARAGGFLRLRLPTMSSGEEVRVLLPLRLSARGALRGLGAAAYPQGDPEDLTLVAPRQLTL
jgi:hypothetical protein